MNKFLLLALIGAASAIKINKADLPYNLEADKIDPVSRYVNDDDLLQRKQHSGRINLAQKADLPYTLESDKIDPTSRYVNDDDIVQIHDDVNLVQLKKADLPYSLESDKIDPTSRYVNDDDIVQI